MRICENWKFVAVSNRCRKPLLIQALIQALISSRIPAKPHLPTESVDLEIYFQSLGQWAVIVIWNDSNVTSNTAPFVLICDHHRAFTDMFLNVDILMVKYCQNGAWKIWGQALKLCLLICWYTTHDLNPQAGQASTRPFSENAPIHRVTQDPLCRVKPGQSITNPLWGDLKLLNSHGWTVEKMCRRENCLCAA